MWSRQWQTWPMRRAKAGCHRHVGGSFVILVRAVSVLCSELKRFIAIECTTCTKEILAYTQKDASAHFPNVIRTSGQRVFSCGVFW